MRTSVLSALPALLVLATSIPAQSASYTYYGTGCSTASPFSVDGLPKLGRTVTVKCYGSSRNFFATTVRSLLTGFSDKQIGPIKLPLYGLGCGALLASNEIVLPIPYSARNTLVSIPVPIPNDKRLVGLSFYQQVVEFARYCSKMRCGGWSISFTRAGHGVIGY